MREQWAALALIALGGNLGDRKAALDRAVVALDVTPGVVVKAVSRYHETTPVGGPEGQGAFLNAAAAVETSLGPLALLETLHRIEREAGRVRSIRWGERTLDLDLVLHGDRVVDTPALRLPHPRMWVRRFVLAPLAEIAPAAIDPSTGLTIRALLENLDRRPSCVAIVGAGSEDLCRRLAVALPADELVIDEGVPEDETYEARSDLLVARETDWYALLDRKVREFDPGRWSGDRWVVTPFWFDLIYREGLDSVADPGRWREQFLKARERIIPPTFLVATRAYTYWQLRGWLDLNRNQAPLGRDVPLIWSHSDGPDRRDWYAYRPILNPDPEEIDRMTAEIVSACAATRAG